MNFFEKIIKTSILKRKALYLFIIIIMVVSTLTYKDITKSLLPDAKFPYVGVYTYMTGATSRDMEELITNKLEEELKDLSDVELMTSTSSGGESLIILKFSEGAKIDDKIRIVQTKVSNMKSELPKKAEAPVVEEYDISKSPIIMLEMDNRLPYKDKAEIIDTLKRKLKAISGVTKVEVSGLDKPRIEVTPNIESLDRLGLSEYAIIEKIKGQNQSLPLGNEDVKGNKYEFQIKSEISSLEEIENIILAKVDSKAIYLRDVCDVSFVKKLHSSAYKMVDGESVPTLLLSVYKQKTADTISINNKIKDVVKEYNNTNEYGIKIDTSMDVSIYISKSIRDVVNNALGGLLSVVVVLFFFIGIKEAFIASAVIPVTLILSFLLFKLFNVTLNIFSIMGLIIALGMLVDNAIVVIEMIDEEKKHSQNLSMKEIVIKSTSRVAPAIFSSTVTTVCALIPLAIMKGDIGSIIREIPLTAVIAMSLSFIISITVTPVLACELIKHEETIKYKKVTLVLITAFGVLAFSNNWKITILSLIAGIIVFTLTYIKLFVKKAINIQRIFNDFIEKLMLSRNKKATVMICIVILLVGSISLLFSNFIKKEAMPESDDINLFGTINLVEGSVLKDAENVADDVNAYLVSKDYVQKFSYYYSASRINYQIELKDKKLRDIHSKEVIRQGNLFIASMPDVKGGFSTDGNSSSSTPIEIRLFANDTQLLLDSGDKVVETLKSINGTTNPRIKFNYSKPTLNMTVDKNKCSMLGVEPTVVMSKLRYMITGEEIITIKQNGKNIKVYLYYDTPFENLENLGNINIKNRKGQNISLLEVIDYNQTRYINTINHYESKKTISVISNMEKGANASIITQELIDKLENDDILPRGVTYKIGGETESMKKSFKDLTEKMIIASILVYIVLVLQFNSYSQPFAIILSIPYAIIGVVLGYGIFGLTFSTLSFLGIVALVGIAVNDAIVLIDYINMLRIVEKMDNINSIIKGCKSRFNPIIATSLTTIAGVLPLAIYNEDYSGMAYSLVFGLVFSTILTLIVVPITLNIIESCIAKLKVWRTN